MASLLLAILSGLIISYPFREEIPLVSTAGLEGVIPFGALFRSFHYYTAQIAFLLLVWHTVEAILTRGYERRRFFYWVFLAGAYPLFVLILFTGYIIRGDETGLSAGRIAENLTYTLPYLGNLLNRLCFSVSEDGVHRAYLSHLFFSFGLLLVLSLWHFRLRRIKLEDLALWAVLALTLALIWPPSLEPPRYTLHIKGPWFFLGIQELLRYLPPFWAGIFIPLLPVTALIFFPKAPRTCLLGLVVWHLFYFIFLGRGLLR